MIGWIFLIGSPALLVFSIIMVRHVHWSDEWRWILLAACGGLLTMMVASGLLYRIEIYGKIAAHKEIGATMARARAADFGGYERATLQRDIVETNKNIRYYQIMDYYWGPFIPDEIHDVEPVE